MVKNRVVSSVSQKTRISIWTRAAGRCQYPGCNKALLGDLIAGLDQLNTGYVAHIVAEKANWKRGDAIRSPLLLDDPANLMLLCDAHHRTIDGDQAESYPESHLLALKREHEDRIETVVQIAAHKASHVVRFGATIGATEAAIAFPDCRLAMAPDYYPAENRAIDLSMTGVELNDGHPDYYHLQGQNLRSQFATKLRGRLERNEITHLSVFALAPIPLLMELGRQISDITPASIMQLHREPKGWSWARSGPRIIFQIVAPSNFHGPVALKLALSATINNQRIFDVLGQDTPIWSIECSDPHNDIMRYPEDLAEFRKHLRRLFDRIKHAHGERAEINIFPALPVSASIEVGRVWMPKADLPLVIYDQLPAAGFTLRHRIDSGDHNAG